jgi:hypothetical protein
VFTFGRPIPLPSWGDGVARNDLGKLQPMCEALQRVQQEGLTRVHLLRTFFNHRIQLLLWRQIQMWLYIGLRYPDRPFSKDLSMAEVDSRGPKVLGLGVL